MVERIIGNDEAGSSILPRGTTTDIADRRLSNVGVLTLILTPILTLLFLDCSKGKTGGGGRPKRERYGDEHRTGPGCLLAGLTGGVLFLVGIVCLGMLG